MTTTHSHIDQTWRALRLTYGLIAFLAGLDKFFYLLTNWDMYLAPVLLNLLPVSGSTMMRTAGVVEVMVGILILTRWTRIGSYAASVWLLAIAFNLVLAGSFFDVAVRDAALSVGAWALARLTEIRQPAHEHASGRATAIAQV